MAWSTVTLANGRAYRTDGRTWEAQDPATHHWSLVDWPPTRGAREFDTTVAAFFTGKTPSEGQTP